ncbi:ribosomal RNA assembly protein [Pancytospora philotis]|nr:ribosomal RNA assembly protein [Pancytospora philotis]
MSRKLLKFDASAFKHAFTERSECKIVFSRIRIEYLRSVEAFIKKACELKKLEYCVDYDETTMSVATTRHTRDPYILIKANDFIALLSKGVPLEDAAQAMEDDVFSEIVPVSMLCASEKTFERRRNRINNPKILKAIELLTKCKVYIAGKVACIIGSYKGLNEAKHIVIAGFENVHPVFEIKKLIIKRQLEKDNVEGDWERFMPTFKKTHSKSRGKQREVGSMPEEIRPRKEDVERETGEYYMDADNVARDKKREEVREKREQAKKAKLERYSVPNE